MLYKVTKVITKNLNKVIDINYYPIPETEYSNKLHRPVGIGVQGLADVFIMMKVGFDSLEAAEINEKIFETIYYGALETSMEIARKREPLVKKIKELKHNSDNSDKILIDTNKIEEMRNEYNVLMKSMKLTEEEMKKESFLGTYSSYEGSPMSKGLLQFDFGNKVHLENLMG